MAAEPVVSEAEQRTFAALLTICCLITFGCYFAVSMRLPVVPLFAREFGVTTPQIGVINAAFYLMAGLLALPSGLLSDVFGRKRLAVLGTVVLLAGMALLWFSRSFLHLAGIYLLLGMGISAFGPTMMTWVSEITPATHLGRAYGWYTTALFCGLGLGPAVGGAVGEYVGFRTVFLTGGTFMAINIWAVLRYLPSDIPRDRLRGQQQKWRSNVRKVVANRYLVGCWLMTFGANIISGVFFSFLPLLAHERGLDVGQIGVVFLVQSVTNALARIPAGTISDRRGRRDLQALTGFVLVSVSIVGFAFVTTWLSFIAAAVCMGASLAVAFTAIGALIAETTKAHYRGLAMGGYNSFIFLGLMSGSVGMGPLIEAVGFSGGFITAGVINVIFIIYFGWTMQGYRPL